ncbi:VOC family protein [Bacillus sp. JJ664]
MAKQITKLESFISPLLKFKFFRELLLLPSTLSGKRSSNKTEDYGVFKSSLVSHLEGVTLYVSDIKRSVSWYVEKLGFIHEGSTELTKHPFFPGQKIICAYLSAKKHENALVLVQRFNNQGEVISPSTNSFFHIAFEIEDGRSPFEFSQRLKEKGVFISYGPVKHNAEGDGESGGNFAVYALDPDNHYLEFFSDMDTIENYQDRYGNLKCYQRV